LFFFLKIKTEALDPANDQMQRSPVSVRKPVFLIFSSLPNVFDEVVPSCGNPLLAIFGTKASLAKNCVHENYWSQRCCLIFMTFLQ
jgi:hypothetical protein